MVYKLYKDSGKGYQNKGIYTKDEIITSLDHTIVKEEFKGRILVVEWNRKDDMEFPALLYTGDIKQYEKFMNSEYTFDEVQRKRERALRAHKLYKQRKK